LQLDPSFQNISGASTPTYVTASAGAGYLPVVRVFDFATGGEKYRLTAFENNFTGGVVAATGDINGDGVDDIVVAAGPGGGPRVRVFDGVTGQVVRDYFAYASNFAGGVWLAMGDFNNDGRSDIVTGAGDGGGAHIRIWDGATGNIFREFFSFDNTLGSGTRVATGDMNGDGRVDLLTATGAGSASQVAVYDGVTFQQLSLYSPYGNFTGGVNIAAADVDGDGRADIITGAGTGGGPRIRVANLGGNTIFDFFAAEQTFSGGMRVASKDINGDGRADIIVGAGLTGLSRVQIFSGSNLSVLDDFYAFDSGVRTGVFVG
jgi:hypothetical protein